MLTDYQRLLNDVGRERGLAPCFLSDLGALFAGDCLHVLRGIRRNIADMVFADPPFNLGKTYGKGCTDRRDDYLEWCKLWLAQCVRILKPGGALFLYNLPSWNMRLGACLQEQHDLVFRHWIAVEMNAGMPVKGRLYPSHYSLLYFTKGPPATFNKIRTPFAVCRHCGKELKDYGGHRKYMHEDGVNLKDVWTDIPVVRHQKYMSLTRKANALSTKLVGRCIEMATNPGDLVLDPFGGSGTTFAVCEEKRRRWVGIEIDFADAITKRLLATDDVKNHASTDTVERNEQ